MILVRYGWKFTPTTTRKAAQGEREKLFTSEQEAIFEFQRWRAGAPSWDYWLIDSRPAQRS